MQSDHETLRKLAKEIVGDEKDPLKAATRIEKWVYKNLRKTYDANADDALTVLENKAGDCTEHTLLFTALARAAGIPAHEVGGLVYAGGDKPSFGWHAWAEIHDGIAMGDGRSDVRPGQCRSDAHQVQRRGGGPGVFERGR